MAAILSNHPLSSSPHPPVVARPAAKTLTLTLTLATPLRRNHTRKPILSSRIRTLSPKLPRRPFQASLKVAGTDPKILNGEEGNKIGENPSDDSVNQKGLPSMKTIIQAYKKAVIDGDDKSICEIEAAICVIEKEKNDLSQKCTDIIAEMASGRDDILRLIADFDNFRKRSEKDRTTFTSDIQEELIESLLPIVDSFERAKLQIKPETEKEGKINTSYQGIYKQFVETMRSLRVSVIGTVGKPFDPSTHEAIGREESQQFKEGIVTQEIRRGFVLGDRILRPATVKVSTGPGPRKSPSSSEGSAEPTEEAGRCVEDSVPGN